MNEVDFRNWLSKNNVSKKMQSDFVSRLKRIEREINHCDMDEQYRSDRCAYIMGLFVNMGKNDALQQYRNSDFPVGKYTMNTFRYAIKQYVAFCDEHYQTLP